MFASWVPGTVIDTNVIEFERKNIFFDQDHLPDILVFDKDYALKYAIDGGKPGSPRRRGIYPGIALSEATPPSAHAYEGTRKAQRCSLLYGA